MRSYLIINADDFGYSYSINKGIIEAHSKGIVSSTSVLVDTIAAHEAKDLTKFPNLSIGLHLDLKNLENVATELERQIKKFTTLVGKAPDHIDTHKRNTNDKGIREILKDYGERHNVPIRNFNAKHIGSFGINSDDCSIAQLKRSVDEATETYNELMTHVGYSDDYLRDHSSYNDLREDELRTICSPEARQYIQDKGLELISWRNVIN